MRSGLDVNKIKNNSIISRKTKEYLTGYLFASPYIIGLIVLFIIPAAMSFYYSFCDYSVIAPPEFVGLKNFKKLFSDKEFIEAFKNTIYFVIIYSPLQTIIALLLAVFLNKSIRFFKGKLLVFLRSIYYFPAVAPWVAIGTVWLWLLNADVGLMAKLLSYIGLGNIHFLSRDEGFLIPTMAFVSIWKGAGYMMFIFLIGLNNIPSEVYEACEIDGVNWWQKFIHITFPLVSPTTFFVFILSLLWGFQNFEQVYTMTNQLPNNNDLSLMVYLYKQGFEYFKMGYASAIAWILFALTAVITLIQSKLQKYWVYY
jgi:multiple sugar transport system permease protein